MSKPELPQNYGLLKSALLHLEQLRGEAQPAHTEHDCPKCGEHFSTCICEEQAQSSPYDPETGSEYKRAHGFNIKKQAQSSPLPEGDPLPFDPPFRIDELRRTIYELTESRAKIAHHAQALADALREVLAYEDDPPAPGTFGSEVYTRCEQALAAYTSDPAQARDYTEGKAEREREINAGLETHDCPKCGEHFSTCVCETEQ